MYCFSVILRRFSLCACTRTRPWPNIRPRAFISYQVFIILTLFANFALCVSHPDVQNIFLLKPYFCICFSFCVMLPYSGYHILFVLERLFCTSSDFAGFLWISKHGSQWFGSTYGCGSNNSSETLSLQWRRATHLVLTHRSLVRSGGYQISKTQICHCPRQPAQASPLRHSGHTWCLQRVRPAFWFFERCFAWAVRKEQVAILFWIEKQGLKPSVLIGKLEQHLPPGISPDTGLFLAMFLIRLTPSMREAVGAGNHKTAAAMVKAEDALWDARFGHNPIVAADMT